MFFFSNIFRNIGRYARRYIPLGLIILFLLTINIAVRCIRHEADAIVADTLNTYGSTFYLVDLNRPLYEREKAEFILENEHVLSVKQVAALHNLEKTVDEGGLIRYEREKMMIAVTDVPALDGLPVQGRVYAADSECCVNRTYYEALLAGNDAENPDFSGVGDTITLTDVRTNRTAELTVVGVLPDLNTPYCDAVDYLQLRIYTTVPAVQGFWAGYRSSNLLQHMNASYTDASDSGTLKNDDIDLSYMRVIEGYETVVEIDSYKNAESIAACAKAKNEEPVKYRSDQPKWFVGETVSGIAQLTAPMERVGGLCAAIDSVTLVVSMAIMLLLAVLLIVERRYEIGILRCLGIPSPGVCVRFTLELLMFLAVVMGLSYAAGVPAAILIARSLSMSVTFAAVGQAGADILLLLGGMGLASAGVASAIVLSKRPMEILNSRT